jgi:hypothetical protein
MTRRTTRRRNRKRNGMWWDIESRNWPWGLDHEDKDDDDDGEKIARG